ncbi:hypothetical protein D3C77_615040 [compost metagenome]
MRHILAINQNLSFSRFFQPSDQAQHGSFAAAGRAEQCHHLSLRDRQVNVLDNGISPEALGDIAQFNEMFLSHSVTPGFWL